MLTTRRGGLALASLLVCSLPASALDLEVEVGLGGLLVPGSWAPVRVTVQLAPDDPPLRGRLLLERPREAVSSCAADVELAPGQQVTVNLAAPVGLTSSDYRVRLLDEAGRQLQEQTPDETWSMLGDDQQLVLLLGRPSLQALRSERDLLPRTVHLSPASFPREPRVLASAAAIFLKGDRSAELRELARDPELVASLKQYVLEGGQLILLADQAELTQPFWIEEPLAGLLPISRVRGQLELLPRQLEAELGAPPDGPVWSLDVLQQPGATPPPVVTRSLGLGRVTVVTFDVDHPRLRPLTGTTGFLTRLVRRTSRSTPRLRDEELSEVSGRVFENTPVVGALTLFLLLGCVILHLIALGPVTSYVTRRRSAWAGLAIPPLASLGLASLILLVASLLRGAPRAQALVYCFKDPQLEQAWSQVDLGLFAGASETFELELGPRLRPKPQRRPRLDALRFRKPEPALTFSLAGHPQRVGPIQVSARGHTWLELTATAELGPQGQAAAALQPPALTLELLELGDQDQDWQPLELSYAGDEPLTSVLLLGIGISETRATLLTLEPGQRLSWNPSSGLPLSATPTLNGSPFDDEPARTQLLLDLAERLERERHRAAAATSPLEPVAFPAYWAVVVRPVSGPGLDVSGESGAVSVQQLQAAFIPAAEPR